MYSKLQIQSEQVRKAQTSAMKHREEVFGVGGAKGEVDTTSERYNGKNLSSREQQQMMDPWSSEPAGRASSDGYAPAPEGYCLLSEATASERAYFDGLSARGLVEKALLSDTPRLGYQYIYHECSDGSRMPLMCHIERKVYITKDAEHETLSDEEDEDEIEAAIVDSDEDEDEFVAAWLAKLISVKHTRVLSSTIELFDLSKLSDALKNGKDKGVAATAVFHQLAKAIATTVKVKGFVAQLPELDAYFVWLYTRLIDDQIDDPTKTFVNGVTKVVLVAFVKKFGGNKSTSNMTKQELIDYCEECWLKLNPALNSEATKASATTKASVASMPLRQGEEPKSMNVKPKKTPKKTEEEKAALRERARKEMAQDRESVGVH